MLKQGFSILLICSLASAISTVSLGTDPPACTASGLTCFTKGFAAGLTPDNDYNNACITGFENVWTYADGTWTALMSILSDFNNLWLAVDKARQFAELWTEQTDSCKVPSIVLGIQGIVSFENLG